MIRAGMEVRFDWRVEGPAGKGAGLVRTEVRGVVETYRKTDRGVLARVSFQPAPGAEKQIAEILLEDAPAGGADSAEVAAGPVDLDRAARTARRVRAGRDCGSVQNAALELADAVLVLSAARGGVL